MTIPLAQGNNAGWEITQGDNEGWIMPSARRPRTSWLARSASLGTFDVHLRRGVQPLALLPPGALLF